MRNEKILLGGIVLSIKNNSDTAQLALFHRSCIHTITKRRIM